MNSSKEKISRQSFFMALVLVVSVLFFASAVVAQTTSFTYQGRLTDGGAAANGNYDLQFALFDSGAGGNQIGATQTLNTVAVNAAIFTVNLDFGINAFPGADRFLEIGVRRAGGGAITTLSPRQQISSTPYAIRTLNAATADTATNATQLGGVAANQYVQTNDSRLSDSRLPTPGSSSYIQNATTPQAGSNFNISGNGALGGTLSANAINATTQYNIGGQRVLSNAGSGNLFAGVGTGGVNTGRANSFFGTNAGFSNATGSNNSFFGWTAGRNNTTGTFNSFFGTGAGSLNTTETENTFIGNGAGLYNGTNDTTNSAKFNTFVGSSAGVNNTTGGSNSFFGSGAGYNNTTGARNTFIGAGAGTDVNLNNLTNATAIGANAIVNQSNSLVLGSISGVNGATSNTNVGIGTPTPSEALTVQTPTSNYGVIQTDGNITVGTFVGGQSATGGWFGTKSNDHLHFFTSNNPAAMTIDKDTSNLRQPLYTNGLVKAIVAVNPESVTIPRCYNSQLSGTAAVTPPCGFFLSRNAGDPAGVFNISFGFTADNRFSSVSAYSLFPRMANFLYISSTIAQVRIYNEVGDLRDASFTFLVY